MKLITKTIALVFTLFAISAFGQSTDEKNRLISNALGQHTASMLSIDDLRTSECKEDINQTNIPKLSDEISFIKSRLHPLMSAHYELLISSERMNNFREKQRNRIYGEIAELKLKSPKTACQFTIFLYSGFHEKTLQILEKALSN